jgi:two-component system response regulator NreC
LSLSPIDGSGRASSRPMIRVLVVDDHAIMRDALAALLGTKPGLEVVGTTAGIRETLVFVARRPPDLMLVDLSLQDGSGVQLVPAMRRLGIKTRLLIMSAFGDEFAVSDALAAGVGGYILKEQPASEFVEAIEVVARGGTYLAPGIAARLKGKVSHVGGDERLRSLTSREHEIFRLFLAGATGREIARRLFISIKTVNTHRAHINRKLAVRTTADLIRFAVASGIAIAPAASTDLQAQPLTGPRR